MSEGPDLGLEPFYCDISERQPTFAYAAYVLQEDRRALELEGGCQEILRSHGSGYEAR